MDYLIKLGKGLKSFAVNSRNEDKLQETLDILPKIIALCGENSNHRRAALRIGRTMISAGRSKIIAPCCPDYTHCNNVYTFKGLNNGVSLLAQNQIEFMLRIRDLGISLDVNFLYADLEADDEKLRAVAKCNKNDFVSRIRESVNKTDEIINQYGWSAQFMSEFIPEFRSKEISTAAEINNNPEVQRRLVYENIDRLEMYRQIDPNVSLEEGMNRTIRTASHYLILGRFAQENHYLISNHTTTNLAWYAETGAGVLHNPVAIY